MFTAQQLFYAILLKCTDFITKSTAQIQLLSYPMHLNRNTFIMLGTAVTTSHYTQVSAFVKPIFLELLLVRPSPAKENH